VPLVLLPILSGALAQDIPSGFKAERYVRVWERNPFALVKPTTTEKLPSAFEKLFLASWLKDGGKTANGNLTTASITPSTTNGLVFGTVAVGTPALSTPDFSPKRSKLIPTDLRMSEVTYGLCKKLHLTADPRGRRRYRR